MRLGRMLSIYCGAMNITQKDLAAELGISESSLTRLMRGDKTVTARAYARIILWLSEEAV